MKYKKPNMKIEEWELEPVLTLVSQDVGGSDGTGAGNEGGDGDWDVEGEPWEW